MKTIQEQVKFALEAKQLMRLTKEDQKNAFLNRLALLIQKNESVILKANKKDLLEADRISFALRKRLTLDHNSIQSLTLGLYSIAKEKDPVGKVCQEWTRKDGLVVRRVLAPIGVFAMIFESRPNIIIEAAALGIKSGNVLLLRGGKEAKHTNRCLFGLIQEALSLAKLPINSVQLIENRDYRAIDELLQMDKDVDLVIPRGGHKLIERVLDQAKMPVILHQRGLCHLYIDDEANTQNALAIALNAKISNPATCNTVETILLHQNLDKTFVKKLIEEFVGSGVEVRADEELCKQSNLCNLATPNDWSTEYLDMVVSLKLVDSLSDAIKHIEKYSSRLTDAIITENLAHARKFLNEINSAVVLVNASNRLADGGEMGLGAEIGISTSSIHMKGPMGLNDLTVSHYEIIGDGHLRK